MSTQHQVRPLSPGVLYNCCQPQAEMCVMNLEVKSCMAWSSLAAFQLARAQRHDAPPWRGQGGRSDCHPLQSAQAAATPAPKPSDAVIPHSKAGELLTQHFPFWRPGKCAEALANSTEDVGGKKKALMQFSALQEQRQG